MSDIAFILKKMSSCLGCAAAFRKIIVTKIIIGVVEQSLAWPGSVKHHIIAELCGFCRILLFVSRNATSNGFCVLLHNQHIHLTCKRQILDKCSTHSFIILNLILFWQQSVFSRILTLFQAN